MDKEKGIKYFDESIKACINFCNSNLVKAGKSKLNINYDVGSSDEIGGTSRYDGENYVMDINFGVLNKINNIYRRLLSKNSGNFYNIVSLEESFDDNKAKAYSAILTEMALNFVIYHELGHVFNGHLKYMYTKKFENINLNLVQQENKELDPMFSQTLEMDADAFAATQCTAMFSYPENIRAMNKNYPGLIKNKVHTFYIFLISSAIMFSELGMGKIREFESLENLEKLYYLPIQTRFETIIGSSQNAYKFLNNGDLEGSVDLDTILLKKFASHIGEFHYMQQIKNGLHDSNLDVGNNNIEESNLDFIGHLNKIHEYWKLIVRPELKEFAIFELAK